MSMKFLFRYSVWLLSLSVSVRCPAQQVAITRADFEVPSGNIFGAALSRDSTTFYAQQYLIGNDVGLPNRNVVISSWDTKQKVMLTSRLVPELEHEHTTPCRRTLIGEVSGHLYRCSGRTSITVLDGVSLATIRSVPTHAGGAIRDYAIDELHNRLYLVEDHNRGISSLEILALDTGALIREAVLPEAELAYRPLIYRPSNAVLAVAFTRIGGWMEKTDIIFYDGLTLQILKRVNDLPRIDDFAFLGSTLLAAPGYMGYKREKCILSIDPQTAKVDKEFCSPETGVDFSLATVSNTFLVAGTGVNRPGLFSEFVKSVSSSLSIWSIETHRLLSKVTLPQEFTSSMAGFTVVGSAGGCFVAYQSAGDYPTVINACIANQKATSRK